MKGTEKQVNWANEIKERVVSILDEAIEMQKQEAPGNASNLDGFAKMRTIVAEFDGYAGDMIDVFRDVQRTGDVRKDVASVVMTARASRLSTTRGDLGEKLLALFK